MRKGFMRIVPILLACLLAVASSCFAENLSPEEVFPAVGDIVTFGHYEQDADESNGPEPIEWIVLDVQDGNALLLSKYGLDAIPFCTAEGPITWEACTLRAWLNGDFLNAAFAEREQSIIVLTDVDNSKAQGNYEWDTYSGGNTQDRIFLLSWAEAVKYLETSVSDGDKTDKVYPKAQAAPTAYALRNGAWTNSDFKTEEGKEAGWWWLRSPGIDQREAACVLCDNSLICGSVTYGDGVIRPALWLDLSVLD